MAEKDEVMMSETLIHKTEKWTGGIRASHNVIHEAMDRAFLGKPARIRWTLTDFDPRYHGSNRFCRKLKEIIAEVVDGQMYRVDVYYLGGNIFEVWIFFATKPALS